MDSDWVRAPPDKTEIEEIKYIFQWRVGIWCELSQLFSLEKSTIFWGGAAKFRVLVEEDERHQVATCVFFSGAYTALWGEQNSKWNCLRLYIDQLVQDTEIVWLPKPYLMDDKEIETP